jgi:hypothetical protein
MLRTPVVLLALAACGGNTTAPAAANTTTTPTKTATASIFELGEITVFEGSEAVIKIHADGTTEIASSSSSYKPGPTLKPDGSLAIDGEVGARVNPDGTLISLKDASQATGVRVADDAFTIDPGNGAPLLKGSLAPDGKITLPAGTLVVPGHELHVTGADTAGKRRATVTTLAFMMLSFPRGD